MTIWTPAQRIRVKVLGLAWRGEALLAAEIEDSAGRVRGVRPLGGSIDFGETRDAALVREFGEGLGCLVTPTGPWHAFENIYEHEGATGHEYVFARGIILGDASLYERDEIRYLESDESDCRAGWYMPHALPDGVELYPAGLAALLREGAVSRPA